METIYTLLSQYWGIVTVVVLGAIYLLVNKTARAAALKYAKSKALTLMFGIEKKAEDFLITEGKAKFDWVVSNGYALLPPFVRLIISPDAFKAIVQTLFDDAVKFVESKQPATTSSSGNVTTTPSQNTTQA